MLQAIQIKYLCQQCGLNQVVTVPARGTDEEMDSIMNRIALSVDQHHNQRNSQCPSRKFDIGIPIKDNKTGAEAARVGDPIPTAKTV